MKKVTLLIVFMLMIAFVYAEDAKVTVTGAWKAQWGMDIDNQTTGFKYVMDGLQIKVHPAVAANSAKKTGAEGETAYGEISMSNIRLEADSGWNGMTNYASTTVYAKWDALVAKIVMGNLTISFKDGASTEINYEGAKQDGFWLTNAYDYPVFSKRYGSDGDSKTAAKANGWEGWNQVQFGTPGSWYSQTMNYGVVAKLAVPNVVNLGIDLASYKAWDDTARFGDDALESDNAYAGRVTAEVTAVKDLILNAGANFGFGYGTANPDAKDIALGARLGYKVAMGTDMSLTPSAAIDVALMDPVAVSVTGGVALALPSSKITANVGYDMVDNGFACTVAANIGMIPNLTLQAALELVDADATADGGDTMAIHGKLAYGIMATEKVKVTPSVQVTYDNKDDAALDTDIVDDSVEDMFVKVGLDIAGLLANTTISLNWDSNDLNNTTADVDTLGQFVATVRISF